MCIFSEQRGCCYVASSGHSTVTRVFASPLHLHRRPLCIDDCAVQSLPRHASAQGRRPADRVFVIELPLPTPSLSPARRPPLESPLSQLADAPVSKVFIFGN